MNRAEIISQAKDYLGRDNLSSSAMLAMIAAVEGELNRVLREHPRNMRIVTHTSMGDLLPVPTDMAQMIQLRANGITYRQFVTDARELAEATGQAYIAYGNCLLIFPPPVESITFHLLYTAFLDPLSSETDENWISKYYPDIYLYGILKEAAVYLKDDARLQLWQSEFVRRVTEVVLQGWNQNISTAPLVQTA